ncbi:DUF3817 domain-containing protein [Actinomycetes bacterium NPDC127524]
MWKSHIGFLRGIGLIEGVSYLVLLFIAMPLKYFAHVPIFVRIFGMAHGVLFVLFVFALIGVWSKHRWSLIRVLGAFTASLLPFGTFLLNGRLPKD